MDKTLYIMRGIPGSGKSTLAKETALAALKLGANGVAICSTDEFFMVHGTYVFDRDKLGENHRKNKERAVAFMRLGIGAVIVDNTNIKRKDFAEYVSYAGEYGYEVREVVVGASSMDADLDAYIKFCHARNTHGVPLEAIDRMARTFER